jgi:hypothetical protein
MFGEQETPAIATGDCCNVCVQNESNIDNFKEELTILIDALDVKENLK